MELRRTSSARPGPRRSRSAPPRVRYCYFCANAVGEIDYKDTRLLQRFITSYGKISSRKRSGTCASHQRELSQAIKRARFMALLPFVIR